MKRLRHVALVTPLLLLLQIGDAFADGLYDGEWTGSATSTVRRCKPATVTNRPGQRRDGSGKVRGRCPEHQWDCFRGRQLRSYDRLSAAHRQIHPRQVRRKLQELLLRLDDAAQT